MPSYGGLPPSANMGAFNLTDLGASSVSMPEYLSVVSYKYFVFRSMGIKLRLDTHTNIGIHTSV